MSSLRYGFNLRCEEVLTVRLRDERRNGVADEAKLLCTGDRELEPVGKALHACGLACREGAGLCRVNEHQDRLYSGEQRWWSTFHYGAGACSGL